MFVDIWTFQELELKNDLLILKVILNNKYNTIECFTSQNPIKMGYYTWSWLYLAKIKFSITWPWSWPFDIEDDLQSWK